MRLLAVTMLAGAVLLGNERAALANKVPCKQIKDAIAAGKTPEQVASELGAKPKRVENCTSGKKKKPDAAPGTDPAPAKAADGDEDGED
jgi:hypothetical protein